jgi:hypothetical protein
MSALVEGAVAMANKKEKSKGKLKKEWPDTVSLFGTNNLKEGAMWRAA